MVPRRLAETSTVTSSALVPTIYSHKTARGIPLKCESTHITLLLRVLPGHLSGKAKIHSMAHKVLDLVLPDSIFLFLLASSVLATLVSLLPCCSAKPGTLWVLATRPLHFLFPLLRHSSPHSSLPYLLQLSFPASPHQFPLTILSKIAISVFPAISIFLSLLRFSSTTLTGVTHLFFIVCLL